MKLTKSDQQILASYEIFMDGLAVYLGTGYELVLHSMEDQQKSVIKIINSFHSGREVGAPMNEAALETLAEIKNSAPQQRFKIYFTHSKTGVLLKSAALPIYGESPEIIGLLCVNFYTNTPISAFFELFPSQVNEDVAYKETFDYDPRALILESLEAARREVYTDHSIPATGKNKKILRILYDKGIFKFKDAVSCISSSLGISKNTVYLHLRDFERTV